MSSFSGLKRSNVVSAKDVFSTKFARDNHYNMRHAEKAGAAQGTVLMFKMKISSAFMAKIIVFILLIRNYH